MVPKPNQWLHETSLISIRGCELTNTLFWKIIAKRIVSIDWLILCIYFMRCTLGDQILDDGITDCLHTSIPANEDGIVEIEDHHVAMRWRVDEHGAWGSGLEDRYLEIVESGLEAGTSPGWGVAECEAWWMHWTPKGSRGSTEGRGDPVSLLHAITHQHGNLERNESQLPDKLATFGGPPLPARLYEIKFHSG